VTVEEETCRGSLVSYAMTLHLQRHKVILDPGHSPVPRDMQNLLREDPCAPSHFVAWHLDLCSASDFIFQLFVLTTSVTWLIACLRSMSSLHN
jgi:hypothetical protein